MRVLVLFIMLLIGLAVKANGNEWYRTSYQTHKTLRDVAMQGIHRATTVGDSGTFLVTTNGGRFWARPTIDNAQILAEINLQAVASYPTGGTVAVGQKGRIVRSTEGIFYGASILDTTWDLRCITWISDRTLMAAGTASGKPLMAYTTDLGSTWATMQVPEGSYTLTTIDFISESIGIAAGFYTDGDGKQNGVILRTEDGGKTWGYVGVEQGRAFTKVLCGTEDIFVFGLSSVDDGGYMRSRDQGRTWSLVSQAELALVTSAYVAYGVTPCAIGHRFIQADDGYDTVATQFQLGANSESLVMSDIADGWQGALAATTSGDRAIMVGDSGRIWVRWTDQAEYRPTLKLGRKHIEFGATIVSRDTVVDAVLFNASHEKHTVKGLYIHDTRDEWKLLGTYNNRDLNHGEFLDVAIRFTPRSSGSHWAFLRIVMEDGKEYVVHLSGDEAVQNAQSPVALQQTQYDFADVNNPLGVVHNIGDVFVNTQGTPVVVSSVTVQGEDAGAFAFVPGTMPLSVGPGETFAPEVAFTPRARGFYRSVLVITVADTQIRLPLVGSTRIAEYNDVIDIGTIRPGLRAFRPVWYSAEAFNEGWDVFTSTEPGRPFRVIGGEPLDFNSYRLDIEAVESDAGTYLAALFGEWGFGGQESQWIERKVLRVRIDGNTSVPDDSRESIVEIAPNPTTGLTTLTYTFDIADALIDIRSMNGESILPRPNIKVISAKSVSVDLSDVPPGVYTATVRTPLAVTSSLLLKR